MAFHYKDGWYFERLNERKHQKPDGTVRIYHMEGTTQGGQYIESRQQIADVDIEIDPDSWASIAASVSLQGENADTFQRALKFHQGL